MLDTPQDAMTNAPLLSTTAYKSTSNLDKRKSLYQYTHPRFNIEDEVIRLASLSAHQTLLDIGCGTGALLLKIVRLVPSSTLVGLDISAGMYSAAQEIATREGLNITFRSGDVQELPFHSRSFDRVVAMHMIYHAKNMSKALSEMARVLHIDGIVLITANSQFSRLQLGTLKRRAAQIMGRKTFTDPNVRFNLESGPALVAEHFPHVRTFLFESILRLTDPQPYVFYFDSLRDFWQPRPNDEEWGNVLQSTREYVAGEISTKGEFSDTLGFGVITASGEPLSYP